MPIAVWLFVLGCAGDEQPTGPVGLVAPPSGDDALRFGFPLAEPDLVVSRAIGVDHDPVEQEGVLGSAICLNYAGETFPYCYDQHDGSDYLLIDGFTTMDAGSVAVLAAADGEVVSVEEAQYDRCHISGTDISCDGFPIVANHVIIEHERGVQSKYWHLMKDSVEVEVGDEVRCGQMLALVGSSGVSSGPHLHFEVEDRHGVVFDPYAGEYSQEESWWAEQRGLDELPGAGCTGLD